MSQIFIFIMDLLTSLINFFSAAKGFKNPSNPPLIIEKKLYIKETVKYKKENQLSKSSEADTTDMVAVLILFVITLGFFIWFDRKYHEALVVTATALTFLTTILYVLLGSKYTLPIKEKLKHTYFFSQPLLFYAAIDVFKKSFDFASAEKVFINVSSLSDIVATFLNKSLPLVNILLPFGIYHLLNSVFYMTFSLGLIMFVIELSARLKNSNTKFIYLRMFSAFKLLFMYLLPIATIGLAIGYSFYYFCQ